MASNLAEELRQALAQGTLPPDFRAKLARLQIWLYAGGQLLHVTGLVVL
mgnify:CR=1 FL=1